MALAAKLAFLLGPLLLTGKTIKCHRKAVFLMAITWLFEKRNFLLPSGFLFLRFLTDSNGQQEAS